MTVYIPGHDDDQAISALVARVGDWELVASLIGVGKPATRDLFRRFETAFSEDRKIWALRVVEAEYAWTKDDEQRLVSGPTSRLCVVITNSGADDSATVRALMQAHGQASGEDLRGPYEVGRFELRENVVIDTVARLFPGAPVAWHGFPASVEVSFALVEGNSVYPSLFDDYRRSDFESAARTLLGTNVDGLFLNYALEVRGIFPHFGYEVEWPLARRGKSKPVRRQSATKIHPESHEPDRTLVELSQSPKGGYFSGSTTMLRVGGRTADEAIDNWMSCARAIRALRKDLGDE